MSFYNTNQTRGKVGVFSTITVGAFSLDIHIQFDKTLERNIYYNHFDGFTSRSNKGLEKTYNYFERLGIKEFVNLVTCTDNYNPKGYPLSKAGGTASGFIPTWMFARPTFDGLRLSLSESSRLNYGEKPDLWSEYIRSARLKGDNIDIDVNFTPGLNVVIGGGRLKIVGKDVDLGEASEDIGIDVRRLPRIKKNKKNTQN